MFSKTIVGKIEKTFNRRTKLILKNLKNLSNAKKSPMNMKRFKCKALVWMAKVVSNKLLWANLILS